MCSLAPVTEFAGVFGPSERLFFNANQCSEEDIRNLTKMLKTTFMNLQPDKHKPEGRRAFRDMICQKISSKETIFPLDIIETDFFQNMQPKQKIPRKSHKQVLKHIVPPLRERAQKETLTLPIGQQEAIINKWCAGFIESYMTPKQIDNACILLTLPKEFLQERTRITTMLIFAIRDKKDFTIENFNSMLFQLNEDVKQPNAENPRNVQIFIDLYIALFKRTTPDIKSIILDDFDTVFRKKYLKTEEKKS